MRASRPGVSHKDGWDGAIADLPNYLYDETTPRVLATPQHSAYIKIAEGCDHPCRSASFRSCAASFARGVLSR